MDDRPRLESCDDPECVFCPLGQRLLDTLYVVNTDPTTEILTLVRVLALTAISTAKRPNDLPEILDAIVRQLRDDVVLLTDVKES